MGTEFPATRDPKRLADSATMLPSLAEWRGLKQKVVGGTSVITVFSMNDVPRDELETMSEDVSCAGSFILPAFII